jgi:predicted SAM-dependent methyltransferase
MLAIHQIRHLVTHLLRRRPSLQNLFVPKAPPAVIRNALRYYLAGNGIEVGALDWALDLSNLPITRVRYVDRFPEDDLHRRYPELALARLVHVDLVDDGEVLGKIEDGSLDFIIGNHFIEHTRDCIGTLCNWLTKLKPGGIIYLAVPEKNCTFDAGRELTSLQHLTADYQASRVERPARDRQHFVEWATFVDKLPGDQIEARAKFLIEIDYSIHFHTFTLQSFLAIVSHMRQELKAPLEIKACADVIQGGDEFLVVLRRS